jgi:hypothetical protein
MGVLSHSAATLDCFVVNFALYCCYIWFQDWGVTPNGSLSYRFDVMSEIGRPGQNLSQVVRKGGNNQPAAPALFPSARYSNCSCSTLRCFLQLISSFRSVCCRLLEKLSVKCPNRNICDKILPRGDLEDHLSQR